MSRVFKCGLCKHRKRSQEKGAYCGAFPYGIPRHVYFEDLLHYHKIEGQVGDFVFSPTSPTHIQHRQLVLDEVEKIRLNRKNIVQEIIDLTKEIINKTLKLTEWKKSYFEVSRDKEERKVRGGYKELHVFTTNNKVLTKKIHEPIRLSSLHYKLLFHESIVNHFVTLRFVVYPNGKHKIELTQEQSDYIGLKTEEIERLLEKVRKNKNPNLLRLTKKEAEEKVKKILGTVEKSKSISDNLVCILLEKEGYLLLKTELRKIRRKFSMYYYGNSGAIVQ